MAIAEALLGAASAADPRVLAAIGGLVRLTTPRSIFRTHPHIDHLPICAQIPDTRGRCTHA